MEKVKGEKAEKHAGFISSCRGLLYDDENYAGKGMKLGHRMTHGLWKIIGINDNLRLNKCLNRVR